MNDINKSVKGIDWSKDNIYDGIGRPDLKPQEVKDSGLKEDLGNIQNILTNVDKEILDEVLWYVESNLVSKSSSIDKEVLKRWVEERLKPLEESQKLHQEEFERDHTAYKYNPSDVNLAKMKMHESGLEQGNTGERQGKIEVLQDLKESLNL